MANVARGRYLRDLGNTPGHVNHWSARRFRNLVDAYLDVRATRTPFPWTVVSAGRRPRPSRPLGAPPVPERSLRGPMLSPAHSLQTSVVRRRGPVQIGRAHV